MKGFSKMSNDILERSNISCYFFVFYCYNNLQSNFYAVEPWPKYQRKPSKNASTKSVITRLTSQKMPPRTKRDFSLVHRSWSTPCILNIPSKNLHLRVEKVVIDHTVAVRVEFILLLLSRTKTIPTICIFRNRKKIQSSIALLSLELDDSFTGTFRLQNCANFEIHNYARAFNVFISSSVNSKSKILRSSEK